MSWSYPSGSSALYVAIAATLVIGFGAMALLLNAPSSWRKPVVGTCAFLAGALYVLYYLWPTPNGRKPTDLPLNGVESVSFWLQDAVSKVSSLGTTLTTFLLGLGIYSLIRIHARRLWRMQRDWQFSLVLLVSLTAIVVFGYIHYMETKFGYFGADRVALQDPANWRFVNLFQDFLFDGLLQQMDAAMFSLIAFYILSAAYRAFRIRSIEATVLLTAALLAMLSLLGAVVVGWDSAAHGLLGHSAFADNFTLTEISQWVVNCFQVPGIRGLDFGIGLGALAMGLRLWLSLERGGVSA